MIIVEAVKTANVALRFVLELCALFALGYWGFHLGKGPVLNAVLGVGSPLLLAVVWGTFGSPKAPIPLPGAFHLLLEVVVLGLPALALYAAGRPGWAILYAVAVVINGVLLYVWHQ